MVNGPNLYTYVTNNPIKYADPYGFACNEKRYGLPNEFWDWYHRQVKGPNDPDLTRGEAEEQYEEWKRHGKPNGEGHRTEDPPSEEQSNFDPYEVKNDPAGTTSGYDPSKETFHPYIPNLPPITPPNPGVVAGLLGFITVVVVAF